MKEFIAEHVHSVVRLEILLLLSTNRKRTWSAETVERKLHLNPHSAKAHLDELLAQGLLIRVDVAAEGLYRYKPSSDALEKTVDKLAVAYATQRVAVLTMVFANPVDKVRLFTETFRMIKGTNEGNGVD